MRSSGTARRWRSRRSRGTSTARRAPITTWGSSPRSGATSRRAEQWYRKALAIRRSRGTSTARRAPITTWGRSPRSGATSRGGAVVPQVAGDQGEAGRRARRGDHLSPTGDDRPGAARLRDVRSSGTARRWRSRRSRATSTARRAPITNWGRSPRSGATSRVRSSGTTSRWRSLRSRATSTARRAPIATWGRSPRSSATSRGGAVVPQVAGDL